MLSGRRKMRTVAVRERGGWLFAVREEEVARCCQGGGPLAVREKEEERCCCQEKRGGWPFAVREEVGCCCQGG